MNISSTDKFKLVKTKRLKRQLLFKKYFGLNEEFTLNNILGKCYLFTDEVAAKKRNNLPKFPRIKGVFQPKKKLSKELCWLNKMNLNEESFYTDSTAFLKGTQSSNPHNDYSQYFVDTGQRPQNFIRDTGLKNRFEEYPKLRELIRLKDKYIADSGSPPMYLQADLSSFRLTELNSKFDVIFVEPPLEEYNRMNGAVYDKYWSWSEVEALEIEQIAAPRSFIWLWCGSGQGLNEGRKCLSKWGFRRCEDICWIKTNKKNPGHRNLEPGALFQRTKEHCLMGIKGTVRRSTDGDFIHANVDIDLIIDEDPQYGVKDKPVEIFHIMEHFCLGKRRLNLFGRDSTIRQGWLTVGSEVTSSNFDSRVYGSFFSKESSSHLVPFNEEIERLRPKSPPPRQKSSQQQQQQSSLASNSGSVGLLGSGYGQDGTEDKDGGSNSGNLLNCPSSGVTGRLVNSSGLRGSGQSGQSGLVYSRTSVPPPPRFVPNLMSICPGQDLAANLAINMLNQATTSLLGPYQPPHHPTPSPGGADPAGATNLLVELLKSAVATSSTGGNASNSDPSGKSSSRHKNSSNGSRR